MSEPREPGEPGDAQPIAPDQATAPDDEARLDADVIEAAPIEAAAIDADSIEAAPDDAGPLADSPDEEPWGSAVVIDVDAAPDDAARPEVASARNVPVADLVLGVTVTGVTAGVAVARGARRVGRPVGRLMMRPPLVPSGLQPASWLEAGARRGAAQRERAGAEMSRLLDALVPMVVEQVVRRIDLTNLVVQQVDLNVVIQRVDLVSVIEQVLDTIDLPEIIRESTGSVASETVRGARMQSIAADEAINRAVDRLLFRRNRPAP